MAAEGYGVSVLLPNQLPQCKRYCWDRGASVIGKHAARRKDSDACARIRRVNLNSV